MENAGVTRISINPQSMSDVVLSAIGRHHTSDEIREAYKTAREKTTADINMDLIAGLPADKFDIFKKTVDEVIEMNPENITIHTLALKRGTKLTLEGGALPDKTEVSKMLDYSQQALRKAGYKPYYLYRQKFMSGGFENIGWAKEGKESLYNILIMEELCTILAAGGGASTKLVNAETGKVERIFDFKYPREYIDGLEKMTKDKEKIDIFYKENMSE
jgi:oxygen-independent coproporphyrinogen-3 oxidase